jgi:uncharacterized protein YciI
MLYALIAFLRDGADPVPETVQVQTTDFLGQPFTRVRMAGPLRDESGRRAGMMMIFEDESREAAEKFAKESPYLKAGLFEDYRVYEFGNEVG